MHLILRKLILTFDKPYIYLIRDKNSGEVWLTGSIYNPTKYELQSETQY